MLAAPIALIGLLVARGGAAPATDPTLWSPGWFPADSVVRAMVAARVDAGSAVGIVVGLIENGEMRIVTAGRSDGPDGRPLDGETVFEIGSTTKVFTGTLLAEMVGRHEVRLDQPLAGLLPKTVRVPARGDTVITLLDLATHYSGLPRLPANLAPRNMENPYADYTVAMLDAFLGSHTLARAPGDRYEYSNLGMGLLGHALARRAHKSYEALLTERVLAPLGMGDTRIALTPGMTSRVAPGHDNSGAKVSNWDMPALAGAGALRSTANDMLRFLAANLDSNDTALSAAMRLSHRPLRSAGGPAARIGLAWHRLSVADAELVMHNGATGGYRSFIGFDPEMRVGVVVLSNSPYEVDDLGLHLLNSKLPLKRVVRRTEVQVDPARLDELAGRYRLAPTFTLTISREGDALFIQATGQSRLRAYAESDSTFFLKDVDAQLSFTRDEAGRASRIVLHQGGRSTPGDREP